MNKKICYLVYNENREKSKIIKIMESIFFKIKLKNIDLNTIEILINKNNINNKKFKKIDKKIKEHNVEKIALSSNLKEEDFIEYKKSNKILNGKFLMKNIIIDIIKYIYYIKNIDYRLEEIYIAINDDNEKDIIQDLIKEFKCVNIITDKIKKLKRLEKRLETNENLLFSISNNQKKALRKAKIIVNFDYNSDFFEKFNINRDALIINLNNQKIELKNSYQGLIIENIIIDYTKLDIIDSEIIGKNLLYESYIIGKTYSEIKNQYVKDCLKIKGLIGNSNYIDLKEIENTK